MARKNADPSPESPPPPPPPAPEPPDIPVVGIGASAGGLDALKQFFRAMPPDCGIAFVVILHLDPTHQSLLAEIIGRETRMPVRQVERPTPVEPDHVYVIPPGTYLALREGVLCLSEPAAARGQRVPIDFFFRSLAGDRREKAVGIILSGTGTEGALGVKDIHAAGGMVLVQAPETAEHPGMPGAAVATGAADHVLPVGQMPARILDHLRHSYVNGGRREGEGPEACPDHLAALLDLVRDRPVTGARDAEGLYRVGFEDKPGETPAAARPEGEANLARQLESELQATRADLQNLLACTDIAAVFLDTEFRIKCFTPVTTRLLNLIPSDVGRPISDLAQKFTCAELLPDARAVLERLAPVEKEVCADDRWFIRRILPYRTHDNRIEGVVITFTDVTSLHRAAEETRGRARQQA
ncbi:MAG TPA: chemotaxis protein CheB, partial [Gemmataceae bacterium]